MAALLENAETPAPAAVAGGVNAQAASEATRYNKTGEMIAARMPDLVKGAGLAPKGGNTLLTDQSDILTRSAQASLDIRTETARGFASKSSVVKSLNKGFLDQFGYLRTALEMPSRRRAAPVVHVGGRQSLTSSGASPPATWVLAPSFRRPCGAIRR